MDCFVSSCVLCLCVYRRPTLRVECLHARVYARIKVNDNKITYNNVSMFCLDDSSYLFPFYMSLQHNLVVSQASVLCCPPRVCCYFRDSTLYSSDIKSVCEKSLTHIFGNSYDIFPHTHNGIFTYHYRNIAHRCYSLPDMLLELLLSFRCTYVCSTHTLHRMISTMYNLYLIHFL